MNRFCHRAKMDNLTTGAWKQGIQTEAPETLSQFQNMDLSSKFQVLFS